jgi:dienelactone hydrolase
MRRLSAWVLLTVLCAGSWALGDGPATTRAAADPVALEVVEYRPLERPTAKLTETKVDPLYTRERLWIENPSGRPIPALFCIPRQGDGPFPVVVLIHGAYDDRKEIMVYRLAGRLAKAGIACISYDLPGHGERENQDDGGFRENLGLMLLSMGVADGMAGRLLGDRIAKPALLPVFRGAQQAVIDGRWVIDYVQSRPEVDARRVAVCGMSLGGTISIVLSATDERISATVTNVAGAWHAMTAQVKDNPVLAAEWARFDPAGFAGRISPRPVLMLNARNDKICTVENAEALFQLLGEPREIRWFDSGHDIPREAFDQGAAWLAEKLGAIAAPTTAPAAAR